VITLAEFKAVLKRANVDTHGASRNAVRRSMNLGVLRRPSHTSSSSGGAASVVAQNTLSNSASAGSSSRQQYAQRRFSGHGGSSSGPGSARDSISTEDIKVCYCLLLSLSLVLVVLLLLASVSFSWCARSSSTCRRGLKQRWHIQAHASVCSTAPLVSALIAQLVCMKLRCSNGLLGAAATDTVACVRVCCAVCQLRQSLMEWTSMAAAVCH
jgi:hypothetical protein